MLALFVNMSFFSEDLNHEKFQINILENKKVIELLELWQLFLKLGKGKKNSEIKNIFTITKNNVPKNMCFFMDISLFSGLDKTWGIKKEARYYRYGYTYIIYINKTFI